MPAYRLGALRANANQLHHEIIGNENALRQVMDRLNAIRRLEEERKKLEHLLVMQRPQLAAMEREIRDLEAKERQQLAPQRAKVIELAKSYGAYLPARRR